MATSSLGGFRHEEARQSGSVLGRGGVPVRPVGLQPDAAFPGDGAEAANKHSRQAVIVCTGTAAKEAAANEAEDTADSAFYSPNAVAVDSSGNV